MLLFFFLLTLAKDTPFLTFLQVKELDLGHGEKPDYFNVKAYVAFAKKESCLYKACPSQDCNKKVTEGTGGMEYFCEKCNQNFPNFKYRMILTVGIVWLLCTHVHNIVNKCTTMFSVYSLSVLKVYSLVECDKNILL